MENLVEIEESVKDFNSSGGPASLDEAKDLVMQVKALLEKLDHRDVPENVFGRGGYDGEVVLSEICPQLLRFWEGQFDKDGNRIPLQEREDPGPPWTGEGLFGFYPAGSMAWRDALLEKNPILSD